MNRPEKWRHSGKVRYSLFRDVIHKNDFIDSYYNKLVGAKSGITDNAIIPLSELFETINKGYIQFYWLISH